MISNLQIMGLVSLVIFIATAGLPVMRKPLDWRGSVSYAWSASRSVYLIVATLITLATAGVCLSLALWTIPHFHLPDSAYGILIVTYVTVLAVAWVPIKEQPGDHSYLHVHFLGAIALSVFALAMMALVIWGGVAVPQGTKITCFVAMVMAASWPLLIFTRLRHWFLVVESIIALTICSAIASLLIW